jgi:hypothetical protein
MEMVYRSKLPSKNNKPFLVFSVEGKLHLFTGRAIGGIVSVKERHSWNMEVAAYTLEVAKGVKVISGNELLKDKCVANALSELCGDNLPTWEDCAKVFEVTVDEVKTFISTHWPFTAENIISATFETVWRNRY